MHPVNVTPPHCPYFATAVHPLVVAVVVAAAVLLVVVVLEVDSTALVVLEPTTEVVAVGVDEDVEEDAEHPDTVLHFNGRFLELFPTWNV